MARSVLVTGASNGIGRGIVDRLALDGFFPVNLDIKPPRNDAPGAYLPVDLAAPDAAAAALDEAVRRYQPYGLVNNVGMVAPAALEDTTVEDLDQVFGLNLRTAVLCTQKLVPGMRAAGGGRIVTISSRAALGKELRSAYAASKAGLIGLTKSWALELAGDGITVNAIGPGPIATDLFNAANPPDSPRTRAIVDGVPVRRLGTPADIAHAAAFFMSEAASFVTGQVLYVCGGMTVGRAA
ncbi:MAG: SDR family oxidoreductase [Proteobacteria bacterium]|nr:SDR family oxidoreductase [Pseudomonadota bacterium]